MINNLT